MSFVGRSGTQDFVVPAGQSVAVGCFGDGPAKVYYGYAAGLGLPAYALQSQIANGAATFGPFSTAQFVRIESPAGASAEYVIGVAPKLTQNVGNAPVAQIPYILAQSGMPVILPSSGASNASGQITHTTALPYQPGGTVQVYLPAGVVVGDATGGLYPAVYSSTTVCQLTGNPATANAAYTQTTGARVQLVATTVPGGALGPNGSLRALVWWSHPGNTNTKIEDVRFGGLPLNGNRQALSASNASFREILLARNRGAQNANLFEAAWGGGIGADSGSFVKTAVDTSQTQPFAFMAQLAVATDYAILEAYSVEVLPSN